MTGRGDASAFPHDDLIMGRRPALGSGDMMNGLWGISASPGLSIRELFIAIGAASHAVAHLGNPNTEMLTAQDCYKGGKAFADGLLIEMEKDSTREREK